MSIRKNHQNNKFGSKFPKSPQLATLIWLLEMIMKSTSSTATRATEPSC